MAKRGEVRAGLTVGSLSLSWLAQPTPNQPCKPCLQDAAATTGGDGKSRARRKQSLRTQACRGREGDSALAEGRIQFLGEGTGLEQARWALGASCT